MLISVRNLLFTFGYLVAIATNGQTIALIDENDSLIIRKKLNVIEVNADQLKDKSVEQNLQYSENIDELLDNQLGLNLTRRGNYAAEISSRGMNSERMTTTINGMKIFNACPDKMDPISSYISANNLKQAEFNQDGHSKCYGSNTGGQINFNTKEATLNDSIRSRSNISIGANSVSRGNQASINTNYSEKNWAIKLNGMTEKHENYKAGGGQEIKNSQYQKSNLGLSIKSKLKNNDFVLAELILDDAENIGYPALPMDVKYAKASIYSITYKKFFNGSFLSKINTKIYGNNIKHKMDDSQRNVEMSMDMPGMSDTYGAFIMSEFREWKRHSVTVMIDGYQNRSIAEMTMFPEDAKKMYMLTWPDVERSLIGMYVSDIYIFENNNKLTVSGRIDVGQSLVKSDLGIKQLSVFGYDAKHSFGQMDKSISISYDNEFKKDDDLIIELAYAERLPSVSEQFGYYIFNSQDGYDYIGNPEIKNEMSFKGEITYLKKVKNSQFESTVFGYNMPNYILGIIDPEMDGMTIGSNGVKIYKNIDFARMTGFEMGFSFLPFKILKISSQFTYTYAVDNENNPLPLIPPLKNFTQLICQFKKNSLGININMASAQNLYSSVAGENATPAYAVADLNYGRKLMVGKKELNFLAGVNNIFDNNYHDHMDWNDVPRPGRNIFIKFSVQF